MSRRCNRSDERAGERKLARAYVHAERERELDRFYRTADWLAIRKRQLMRSPLCEACDPPRPAEHVDHIKRIRDGGSKRDPANLMSLCASCHNTKSRLEGAGRKWIMPKHKGCDARGMPRDPSHPWHKAELALAPAPRAHPVQVGGVRSPAFAAPDRSGAQKQT